ncbi:hypothetical protein RCL1_007568 [Eukaryota sp. TZLM3-RCL]
MTNDLAGAEKNIVNDPITVEVHAENLPNLSIIDLPGITHNAVKGQPQDIYERIKALYLQYIEVDTTIICNVHPATNDVATSESIKLSRMVDPEGVRTICVLSKVDNAHIDVAGILQGTVDDAVPLHLGYVAVRNPSSNELKANISFSAARDKEREYFANHRDLSKLGNRRCGIDALSQILVSLQNQRVSESFPKIKKQIRDELRSVEADLKNLPADRSSEGTCYAIFLEALSEMSLALKIALASTTDNNLVSAVHVDCQTALEQALKVDDLFMTSEVQKRIEELELAKLGHSLSNFLTDSSFVAVFNNTFKENIPTQVEALVDRVENYVQRAVESAVKSACCHLERGLSFVQSMALDVVQDSLKEVYERIAYFVSIELQAPSTVNHYYSETFSKMKTEFTEPRINSMGQKVPSKASTMNESQHRTLEIQLSLRSYWKVFVKRFFDYVNLIIRHYVFNLPTTLRKGIMNIATPDSVFSRLRDETLEARRSRLYIRRDNLKKAAELFN